MSYSSIDEFRRKARALVWLLGKRGWSLVSDGGWAGREVGWGKRQAHGSSKREEEGEKEGLVRFDAGMIFRDEDVGSVLMGAARATKKLGGTRSKT